MGKKKKWLISYEVDCQVLSNKMPDINDVKKLMDAMMISFPGQTKFSVQIESVQWVQTEEID